MPDSSPNIAIIGGWFTGHYQGLVRYLARRIGPAGAGEAEDLAQEAFLRLLRIDRAELIRNPKGYLHQVAANVLLEWRLRARQQRPHSSADLDFLAAEESVEEHTAAQQTQRLLRHALRELPPLCQAVLLLRSQDSLTNEQIAARLGITRRMVKRFLESGYAELRDRLSRLKL